MHMTFLSIIIPFDTAERYLKDCLDSIAYHKLDDTEVIIILNGNKENVDDLIESYNHLSEKSSYSCPKLNLNIEERDMIIKWLIDSTRPNFRSYNDRASNPRLVLDIIKEAYAIASLNNQDEVTMVDLKEAILLEERLYLSSRKRQVQRLDEIKPSYKKDNVIPFRLILKK